MKKTKILLFCLGLSSAVLAQNGGQASENPSLKIEFAGVTPSGNPIIKATNKQDCLAQIRMLQGQDVRFKGIPAMSSDTFVLPLSSCHVTAKTTTNCGVADFGQVELNICSILPLRFEGLTTRYMGNGVIEVRFKIVDLEDRKLFIQLSKDGIHYRRVGIEVPASAKVGESYIVNIKL